MPPKRKKQIHAARAKSKKTAKRAFDPENQTTVGVSFDETTLTVVKDELIDDILLTTPKDLPLFCILCLRKCTQEVVVEFSSQQNWNCLSTSECQDKLETVLGSRPEIENCAICRSCWALVETFIDFRKYCLNAIRWKNQFVLDVKETEEDGWLIDGWWLIHGDILRLQKVIRNHVEVMKQTATKSDHHEDADSMSVDHDMETKMNADDHHSSEEVSAIKNEAEDDL